MYLKGVRASLKNVIRISELSCLPGERSRVALDFLII